MHSKENLNKPIAIFGLIMILYVKPGNPYKDIILYGKCFVLASRRISISQKFDTDNSTHVTRKEFADFIDTNYPEFFHYEGYAYQQFDFNQDGHLTMDDFEHFLESHDPDHDEIITDKEFVDYFSVLLEGLELLTEIQDFVTDVATMDPQDQDMTTASMV